MREDRDDVDVPVGLMDWLVEWFVGLLVAFLIGVVATLVVGNLAAHVVRMVL